MKELLNLGGGALTLNEGGGKVVLALDKSAAVGGGEAADILEIEGCGKATFNDLQAVKLAWALLNKALPSAALLVAEPIESFINNEIASQ